MPEGKGDEDNQKSTKQNRFSRYLSMMVRSNGVLIVCRWLSSQKFASRLGVAGINVQIHVLDPIQIGNKFRYITNGCWQRFAMQFSEHIDVFVDQGFHTESESGTYRKHS